MGSCSLWRAGLDAQVTRVVPVHLRFALSFSAMSVGAMCALLGPVVADAAAQADAGHLSGNTNTRMMDVAARAPGSASFQKTLAPSHLPESVQRRLRERAAADSRVEAPEPAAANGPVLEHADAPRAVSEAARRIGEARMRRVQAFDTGKGVTILSNRLSEPPNPTRVAAQTPGPVLPREGETVIAPPPLTETRSLRAAITSAPMPRDADPRGWLWPLAALLAVSAGLGTLLYRKASPGKVSSDETRP